MGLLDEYLPAIGSTLGGRYRISAELGRGAFGIVYRAEQVSLGMDVAIKVLLPRVVDDERVRTRFGREIEVAKALRHPNTIRILDVATTLKGLPFYVMEYVDGPTLADVVRDDVPLSVERTVRVVEQILKSLSEAHEAGIVHRDLKPSNVMVAQVHGEPDFVKVLDFGIAKALGHDDSWQTATGAVLGTPYFMAPEQAAGRKAVDGRADLYSLGILTAVMLGGGPEFEEDTALEYLAAQLAPEQLPFPDRVRRSPLWPMIERATQKDISARFDDAAEMLAELRAFERNGHAAPPSPALQAPIGADDVSVASETPSIDEPAAAIAAAGRPRIWAAGGAGAALLAAVLAFSIRGGSADDALAQDAAALESPPGAATAAVEAIGGTPADDPTAPNPTPAIESARAAVEASAARGLAATAATRLGIVASATTDAALAERGRAEERAVRAAIRTDERTTRPTERPARIGAPPEDPVQTESAAVATPTDDPEPTPDPEPQRGRFGSAPIHD